MTAPPQVSSISSTELLPPRLQHTAGFVSLPRSTSGLYAWLLALPVLYTGTCESLHDCASSSQQYTIHGASASFHYNNHLPHVKTSRISDHVCVRPFSPKMATKGSMGAPPSSHSWRGASGDLLSTLRSFPLCPKSHRRTRG
jgi:hypothetical protein